jgi:hypothetical protein
LEPLLRLQERDRAIQYSLELPWLLDCPVSGLPLRKRSAHPGRAMTFRIARKFV